MNLIILLSNPFVVIMLINVVLINIYLNTQLPCIACIYH